MTRPRLPIPALLVLGSLGFFPTVQAATLNWPSAACAGTLQACINAAVTGDEIQIVTEAPIIETLSISNKSLRLYARGTAARFGPGRGINLAATSGNVAIALENLWFYGAVRVQIGSVDAGQVQSVNLNNLRVETEANAFTAVESFATSEAASTYTVTLNRSTIVAKSSNDAAVAIRHSRPTGNPTINVLNNRISSASDGVNLTLGAGRSNVLANEITYDGPSSAPAFGVAVEGRASGPSSVPVQIDRNVIHGYRTGVYSDAVTTPLTTRVINNTLVRSGQNAIEIRRNPTSPVHTARIANNLISRANCGVSYNDSSPTATADYNFFHAVVSNNCLGATAGANDRSGSPLFNGGNDFRTRSGSPNHNVGSNADQPTVPIIVPVPTPDFDGRAGRVGGIVDMGAFEFSFDTSFEYLTRADNTAGNVSNIAGLPEFFLLDSDVLQLGQFGRDIDTTPVLPGNASAHLGVWWNTDRWTVFNQNIFGTIALDRRFFVLLNVNSNTSYIHVVAAPNLFFNTTTLDHPELNNRPTALPIITQHWDPDHNGTGTYNASSIGVWYDAAVSRWKVFNQAPAVGPIPAMPIDAAFNVLIPNALFAAGSHAYRTEALGVPVGVLFLDHPLLNNLACAHPYVTASYNPNFVYVPSNLVTSYNPSPDGRGAWAIERGDGLPIPANSAFHVYIDPQQSRRCGVDAFFQDGFE